MVWRCVLGGDRIAVSRPGRDAFSANYGDLLMHIGINCGQILEMSVIPLTINKSGSGFFQSATGRYNFQRTYSVTPDIRVRAIENGESVFPATRWVTKINLGTSYADITLGPLGSVQPNPTSAMVMLFRKPY